MPGSRLLRPDEMTGRGVFLARTLTADGYHWYYSVTSANRELERVEVKGAVTPEGAQRVLWTKLNAVDPERRGLALVKDAEVERRAPLPAHVNLALWGQLRPHRPA